MRRTGTIILAAVIAAGCYEPTGPAEIGTVYALARVGTVRLPVYTGPGDTFPLLLADTLRLLPGQPGDDQTILRQATVVLLEDPRFSRVEAEYYYQFENGQLTFDQCPIGYFCAAVALVGSPRVFNVVGDSLFEAIPAGTPRQPYVYGRVRN